MVGLMVWKIGCNSGQGEGGVIRPDPHAVPYRCRLRDRLATADLRLSVVLADANSSCPVSTTATTGREVHGPTRAELAPANAQRIIGITDADDQGLIALRACQAYAKEVSTPK
jgi:hypothetical protein